MTRRIVLLTAAAVAAPLSVARADSTAPATPATSDDDAAPTIGVGFTRTLAGITGPSLRLGDDLQLELVLGADHLRQDDHRISSAAVSARVLVPLLRRDEGWLGLVGGVTGYAVRRSGGDARTDDLHATVEAGLHAEWFVRPALSLGFEVGATAAAGGTVDRDGDTDDGWWGYGLGRSTGTAATVTYWLDAEDEAAPSPSPSGLRLGIGAYAGTQDSGLALALDLGRLRLELVGSRDYTSTNDGAYGLGSASIGALYEVARTGPVALSAGARAGVTGDPDNDYAMVSGALPVRIELDATDWMTLHAEGGVTAAVSEQFDYGATSARLVGATGGVGFTAWL